MTNLKNEGFSGTKRLTLVAMFTALSTALSYLEFPLPFMPPFLKLDLSGVPIFISAFLLGPHMAVIITLVKNLIRLLSTTSGGVGEIADFIILSCFSIPAALIYGRKKDKRHAIAGCCAATLVIPAAGFLANKFLLIPFYSKIMPIDAIIKACAAVNPYINTINAYYIYGVLPFNLIKGIILSAVTILCYKKMSAFIKRVGGYF